ncbi:MAG: hypothetical protein LBM19_01345 [Holosporales bacterium]|jgi:hypothetical protein|nr:hypothetical protein [Holosporales bacterium]
MFIIQKLWIAMTSFAMLTTVSNAASDGTRGLSLGEQVTFPSNLRLSRPYTFHEAGEAVTEIESFSDKDNFVRIAREYPKFNVGLSFDALKADAQEWAGMVSEGYHAAGVTLVKEGQACHVERMCSWLASTMVIGRFAYLDNSTPPQVALADGRIATLTCKVEIALLSVEPSMEQWLNGLQLEPGARFTILDATAGLAKGTQVVLQNRASTRGIIWTLQKYADEICHSLGCPSDHDAEVERVVARESRRVARQVLGLGKRLFKKKR